MEANNIILQLPFDEGNGSTIAYDYSNNRADGTVENAQFVPGKNGNAIEFDGSGTCEIEQNVIGNLAGEFSMVMYVKAGTIECGSPSKVIWLLNFSGVSNFVEVPITVKAGQWYSLACTRRGTTFKFYLNATLVETVNKTGSLVGISLNQDYYGSDKGFGCLDDVVFYRVALEQSDIIGSLTSSKEQAYLLDGVNFKEFGVSVSDSSGVVNRPKLKALTSVSWDNYHGESVDLLHKFFEPRKIVLSCYIQAPSKSDFISRVSAFESQFDKQGTQRLVIDVHPIKPLIYEVYCQDEIAIAKKWNSGLMVGTFKLTLIEPEPLKRILKHIRIGESTKTCSITLTTTKMVNIYWGDGSVDYDVYGDDYTITHTYAENGEYFPVITGCIDEISAFTTNAIVVWNRL